MASVDNAAVANDQGGLNWKIESDGPIRSANIAIQNQVTNQQAVDTISREALQTGIVLGRDVLQRGLDFSRAVEARAIRFIFDTSAEEAVGFAKQIGSDLTSKLADIEGLLAAGQQQEKTAITSPPQTGTGGAFGSGTGSSLFQSLAEATALLGTLRDLQKAA